MTLSVKNKQHLFGLLLALCFMPFVSPALALCAGIGLSLLGIKNKNLSKYTSKVLQGSIVLMGFGMSLAQVISASKNGFIETAISVSVVMLSGIMLGKLFKVESNIALLIASGTAICGGSAIAAVSPVLGCKNYQSSFALIVVFVLNAIALLLFPYIGHRLHLSQEVFGNWAAIAIHDTSSVVGAGATYGEKALQIATTVKLIRALWIIPLSIVIALFSKNGNQGKIKFPWFILLFVAAILISNFLPSYSTTFANFNWLGKRGMVVALFLIGANISIDEIKQSGLRSFVLGIALWAIIATGSLLLLNY